MASDRGRRAALRLAALLTTTGTLHFATPEPFDAIVPPPVPGPARLWTHATGAAELGIAALLAVPRTRRLGGSLAAAFFVAVFPANVRAVRLFRRGSQARTVALARLPLQVPLVVAALRARE